MEEEEVHHLHPLHPQIMKETDALGEDRGQDGCMYCKVQQDRPEELEEMEETERINDLEINEVGRRSRSPQDIVCWGCGQNGHYQRDCPYKMGNLGAGGPIDEGVVGQMQHTLITSSDITNKMMGELYKQLAAAELKGQLYKRGYKRAKANIAQSGTMATTITPAQMAPRTTQYVTSATPAQTACHCTCRNESHSTVNKNQTGSEFNGILHNKSHQNTKGNYKC